MLLGQPAGEGPGWQLEASEQRRAPRPSVEAGTPPQRCSGSAEKQGSMLTSGKEEEEEEEQVDGVQPSSPLTSCWTRTMSIRFWAPGDRLVPISSTRLCTCCMSMVAPYAGLDGTCHMPTTTRHSKMLRRPPRDSSWDGDRRVSGRKEGREHRRRKAGRARDHLDFTGRGWMLEGQLFPVEHASVWTVGGAVKEHLISQQTAQKL